MALDINYEFHRFHEFVFKKNADSTEMRIREVCVFCGLNYLELCSSSFTLGSVSKL